MLDEVSLAKYIEQAVKLRLAGHELLLCRTIPEILRSANGIGPEAFPDKLRKMIDNANPTMIFMISDIRMVQVLVPISYRLMPTSKSMAAF